MTLQLLVGLAVVVRMGSVLLPNEAEVAALRTEARMKMKKGAMARFSSYSGSKKTLSDEMRCGPAIILRPDQDLSEAPMQELRFIL